MTQLERAAVEDLSATPALANNQPGQTRHFATLDGMRGVAAISVVTIHATPFTGTALLPSASLAVDLFFLLSGFVLTHAYSKRLDAGLKLRDFFAIRLTRLSPLYAVGAALGTLLFVLQFASGRWELGPLPTVFSLLSLWVMMPSPFPDRFDQIFIINNPRWSLFYEDAVNLVMALCWPFFRSTARLAMTTGVLGVGLILCVRHYHTQELGWASHTFLAGFLRVGFPFFTGMLLYRLHGAGQKVTWLANLIPFLLVPLFALYPDHLAIFRLLCIVVAFPLLVFIGARVQPPSSRLCRFLGEVSYPLYIIHMPLLGLAQWGLEMDGVAPADLGVPAASVLIALLVAISWVLAKTYDPFARAWLGSKLHPLGNAGLSRPQPLPSKS